MRIFIVGPNPYVDAIVDQNPWAKRMNFVYQSMTYILEKHGGPKERTYNPNKWRAKLSQYLTRTGSGRIDANCPTMFNVEYMDVTDQKMKEHLRSIALIYGELTNWAGQCGFYRLIPHKAWAEIKYELQAKLAVLHKSNMDAKKSRDDYGRWDHRGLVDAVQFTCAWQYGFGEKEWDHWNDLAAYNIKEQRSYQKSNYAYFPLTHHPASRDGSLRITPEVYARQLNILKTYEYDGVVVGVGINSDDHLLKPGDTEYLDVLRDIA